MYSLVEVWTPWVLSAVVVHHVPAKLDCTLPYHVVSASASAWSLQSRLLFSLYYWRAWAIYYCTASSGARYQIRTTMIGTEFWKLLWGRNFLSSFLSHRSPHFLPFLLPLSSFYSIPSLPSVLPSREFPPRRSGSAVRSPAGLGGARPPNSFWCILNYKKIAPIVIVVLKRLTVTVE